MPFGLPSSGMRATSEPAVGLAHVDRDDFTIAIGADIGDRTVQDHRVGERAALGAVRCARSCKGPQVVFITDGSGRRVNHADRIVVVVGRNERFAVGRNGKSRHVGLDAETEAGPIGSVGHTATWSVAKANLVA